MSSMIYDGFDFGHYLIIDAIRRPVMPRVDVQSDDLSGDGSSLLGVRLDSAEIEVDVRLYRPFEEIGRRSGFEEARRMLASRLLRRSPCKLVLPDAPDIYNMAVLDGSTDLERISRNGLGTLTFFCPEAAAYGALGRRACREGSTTVRANVGGNYPTAPVITVTAQTSNLTVTVDGATMRALGTVEGADPLVIDCERHVIEKGGETVMLDVYDSYPSWEPGVHVVECSYPFSVEWRERWL